MVLCRELTKKFEEIIRGTPGEIADQIPHSGLKGEVVLVIDRPPVVVPETADLERVLVDLLAEMSVRDAAAELAERFNISRRDAYQMALSLGKEG